MGTTGTTYLIDCAIYVVIGYVHLLCLLQPVTAILSLRVHTGIKPPVKECDMIGFNDIKANSAALNRSQQNLTGFGSFELDKFSGSLFRSNISIESRTFNPKMLNKNTLNKIQPALEKGIYNRFVSLWNFFSPLDNLLNFGCESMLVAFQCNRNECIWLSSMHLPVALMPLEYGPKSMCSQYVS